MNYDPNNLNLVEDLRNYDKERNIRYNLNVDNANLKKYFPSLEMSTLESLSLRFMPRNGRNYYIQKGTDNVYSKCIISNSWGNETDKRDWKKMIENSSFIC